eukprot:jgi/Orpsp1_1/1180361/evm.model.c7180000073097.1
MNNTIISFLFIFFIIYNFSFVKSQAQAEDEIKDTKDFRAVRDYKYTKGNYFDYIKYEFDITPTRNVGKFDYYVFSDNGVYTLVMNRTEYDLWSSKYYDQWLNDPTHDLQKYISYLNTDNTKFMCMSLTAACQCSVQFPDRELYVVNVKNPTFEDNRYFFKDNFTKYKDDPTAAKLIYDPVNPPAESNQTTSSSLIASISPSLTTQQTTSIDPSKTTESINGNNNDVNGTNSSIIKNKSDDSSWWWWLIGGIILLLIILALLLYALMHRNKKDKPREIVDEDSLSQNNYSGSENDAKVVAYNPHHAVKRVAYNYKADDISFERDNIVEITKRYNDGWANAINPKDGKECIIPLIILEGDLSEDLSNIPYEEKSSKTILATPESLYENEFISQKDYEEMKRNDEWIKKVKLMKHSKPESTHNMIGDNDQIKYISHPMQETKVENGIDIDQNKIGNNRKSMVATVVNSNTELLNADHILEVCEEEDYEYEPEEGVIIKEDL